MASAGVGQTKSSSSLGALSTTASGSQGALSREALGLARGVGSGWGVSGIEEDSSDWVGGVGVELGLVSWQGLALGLTLEEEEGVEVVALTDS